MKLNPRQLLPVGILAGGVAIAGLLIASGGSAQKAAPEIKPLLVQTISPQLEDLPIPVRGTGVVTPAKQVAVVPQVAGKIVETSPKLMPGGRFKTGEVIAKIDARDYLAARDAAQSQAQRAELELALERGRGEVAEREWTLIGEAGSTPTDLALRKPQYALAEQNLLAAKGALAQASLNVQRTRLTAPFNAVVVSENIDIGQVVGPGSTAATLVGTDQLWVTVSLPISEVDVLQFGEDGSAARVIQRLSDGRTVEHEGRALQLGGALDPATRLAQVTVGIDRPYDPEKSALPLLPGAYVEVIFEGLVASQVSRIPRAALYGGDTVWVTQDGTLVRRTVEIAGGDGEAVLVSNGLKSGDAIITTALSLPVAGTPVETAESTE
jgi:RND family efflux transporter MFP subunit